MVSVLIRRVMKECGLKQKELADLLGVPLQRVKRLAGGDVKNFTREEHEALVTKLNIRADWLITGEGQMFRAETQRERAAQLAATPNAYAVDAVREIHGREEVASPPAKGTPPAPTRDELARGTRADPDWPLVMEWVYDALNARKLRMPDGKKLRELVDAVLVLLRLEQGELDREKTRRKIDAIL